jgi:hypothetical protein
MALVQQHQIRYVMKRNFLLIVLLCMAAIAGNAQTPTYSNQAGGIANAIPLNSNGTNTWRKVQWYIPASSLGTLSTMHNITHAYFQAGTSVTQVYPTINIRMKIGTGMTSLQWHGHGAGHEPRFHCPELYADHCRK